MQNTNIILILFNINKRSIMTEIDVKKTEREIKRIELYNLINQKIIEYNEIMQPCRYEYYLSSLVRDVSMRVKICEDIVNKQD